MSTQSIEFSEQHINIQFSQQCQLSIPQEDGVGRACLSTWLVVSGQLTPEDGAQMSGVSVETVLARCIDYQESHSSLSLIDRRHFNAGQKTAYRMEAQQADAVSQWVMNLLCGESNSGRHLSNQLDGAVDDRTVDRFLNRGGMRQAEEAGLRPKVEAYQRQQLEAAYWAGVRQEPLVGVSDETLEDDKEGWDVAPEAAATAALITGHLVHNGAYAALERLDIPDKGKTSNCRFWHRMLTFLAGSNGGRLSHAERFDWESVRGLFGGHNGLSASFLRDRLHQIADAARDETVTVDRGEGQVETISRLQDYQEESIAQRVRRGLVKVRTVWLDDLVNSVCRKEKIARAWHGTKHWAVKAFRRHIVRDVETKHAVTCPLSCSDVKPVAVFQKVAELINNGLRRVEPLQRLGRIIADRWWSNKACLQQADDEGPGLVTWGKETKSVRETLDALGAVDERWQPIYASQEEGAEVVGWLLDTEATPYKLQESVRFIAFETAAGHGNGTKLRLGFFASGVCGEDADAESLLSELRGRPWVESLIKDLSRRLQLPNFGGGNAREIAQEPGFPNLTTEQALEKLARQKNQVSGRQRQDKERLAVVQAELAQREGTSEETLPADRLTQLGKSELKGLHRRYQKRISRAQSRQWEIESLITHYEGRACWINPDPEYELDLSQETILTQLKLDIHTAHQTLLDEFIEQALQPVLWEEAQRQAQDRQQRQARSTAKGREGELLSTDVKELYEIKVANLQRERILHQLLHQRGYYLYHSQKRIIISVAYPFQDQRLQAAYERYCTIINQKRVRVPIDRDEDWLLLFTWNERGPPSPGDSNDALSPPKNHM
jgi:hypothetical protein